MFLSKYKDDSEKSTGLLFMRTYNKWHFNIKNELKKLNLTHPQFVVLASLSHLSQENDEVTQIMISKISGIDVMTISQILNLLEKNDFIKRKEHSKDTRAKSVFLNKKGDEILSKAIPVIEKIDKIFFGKLKNKEEELKKILIELSAE